MAQKIQGRSWSLIPAASHSRSLVRPRPLLHPAFLRLPPPVVVIGAHRSGTSLVAASLAVLGAYLGPECSAFGAGTVHVEESAMRSGYAEARDFYLLNELLLARAGASWDRVEPFLLRRPQPGFARISRAILRCATFGHLRTHYLPAAGNGFEGPWGWKDPRTSLTLPLWEGLFPELRIIHVRRDPDAVADSLFRRAHARSTSPAVPATRIPLPPSFRLEWHLGNPGSLLRRWCRRAPEAEAPAPPPHACRERDYCRALADRYAEVCLEYRSRGERYQEVWYEEFLDAPAAMARRLAEPLGCRVTARGLQRVTKLVRERS